MLSVEDEICIWEELLRSVSKVLSEVCDCRSQAQGRCNDDTSSFDRVEYLISDVHSFIEGRLQELEPSYSERKAFGVKAKAQARKALSYGINYQALRGVPYDETDKVLMYIEEHGLVSMDYETTKKALRDFREYELRKRLQLH